MLSPRSMGPGKGWGSAKCRVWSSGNGISFLNTYCMMFQMNFWNYHGGGFGNYCRRLLWRETPTFTNLTLCSVRAGIRVSRIASRHCGMQFRVSLVVSIIIILLLVVVIIVWFLFIPFLCGIEQQQMLVISYALLLRPLLLCPMVSYPNVPCIVVSHPQARAACERQESLRRRSRTSVSTLK